MTMLDPSTSRRRSLATIAGGSSTASRVIRLQWRVFWLVAVPLLVGIWVDQQVGTVWGSIPAFWAAGDPAAAGPNIAGALASLGAVLLCAALHHVRGDVPLGVVPTAAAVAGHVGFGGGPAGWIGGGVGLAVGGIWFAVRRRQGR